MVDKDKIMQSLKLYFTTTGTITISDEGLVSCTGKVELKQELKHEKLPVAFDRVSGHFGCWGNQLTTLKGAPKSVPGDFLCGSNKLTALEGAPKKVDGDFGCSRNQLTTLEGAPQSVGGDFYCVYNEKLTTLEGLPAIQGTLYLSYNPTLPLLRCLLARQVRFVPALKDKTIETILNRYAGQGRRVVHLCAKDLIASGFEENARW